MVYFLGFRFGGVCMIAVGKAVCQTEFAASGGFRAWAYAAGLRKMGAMVAVGGP